MKANKTTENAGSGRGRKRKRLSGVRGRVLELLGAGPMTSAQLVRAGGFSAASLYLNLKVLKKEGLVQTRRDGRSVVISLLGGAGAATAAAPAPRAARAPRASGPAAAIPAYVPRDLAQALEGLSRRLSPVERLDDKVLVLQQLSRSLRQPVAGLLEDIVVDLKRIGSAAA